MRQALPAYSAFLRDERRLAPGSVKLYMWHLQRFAAFSGEVSLELAGAATRPYLASCARAKYSVHFVDSAIDALRGFWRWAAARGFENPMLGFQAPTIRQMPKPALSREEVRCLLKAVLMGGGLHAQRNFALTATLYYAGLRVGEACGLKPRDADFGAGVLIVIGKGGKERIIPMHKELAAILRHWLDLRAAHAEYLFPAQAKNCARFGRLGTDRVELLLREVYGPAAKLAGRVTPHTLRRSFARHLHWEEDAPLGVVQDLLGHSDPGTTKHYLGAAPSAEMRRWVKRL